MSAPLSCKQFSAIAKALADPRRYGILSEIAAAGEQLPCSALKAAGSVTAATISHHIKDLEAAGLIELRLKTWRSAFHCFIAARAKSAALSGRSLHTGVHHA